MKKFLLFIVALITFVSYSSASAGTQLNDEMKMVYGDCNTLIGNGYEAYFDIDLGIDFWDLNCYMFDWSDEVYAYKMIAAESENEYWVPYNKDVVDVLSTYNSYFSDGAEHVVIRIKWNVTWWNIGWLEVRSLWNIENHDLLGAFYSKSDIRTNTDLKLFAYSVIDKYCTKSGSDLSCWTYESYENVLGAYIDKVLANLWQSHIVKMGTLIDNIPALEQKYGSDEKRVFMFQYLRYKLEQRYLELVGIYWVE